jgi:probable rRNA maturation factor
MPEVEIKPGLPTEITPVLLQAARLTLEQQGLPAESSLSIVLSDDKQLQALNRQFLEIDEPTDVLSFPAGQIDPESGEAYLGDIVISYERALAQATQAGHSVEAELQLLVVHGVLHLLGYDHAEPDEKAAMWAAQSEALTRLGLQITPP